MPSYQVVLNFNDGTNNYDFPHVYSLSDPIPGMKAVIIEGKRGDGSICIPAGLKSVEIEVKGRIFETDGYADIMTAIGTMRTDVTTNVATLTLKHYDIDESEWVTDWAYQVRRISEINFEESLRTDLQSYSMRFLVLAY